MKKQNNSKESRLIDLINDLRDTVEELYDWEQEDRRVCLLYAYDEMSGRATYADFGDEKLLERGLFFCIKMLSTESRHRITLALAEKYRAEMDEDEALANHCPPAEELN